MLTGRATAAFGLAPLRQWVLSAPFDLRIPMARDASLLTAVTRIFCSEIERLLQRRGEERGVRRAATGQVAAIQLFGGSLNLNPHQHVVALDGACVIGQAFVAVFMHDLET